ncbi:MAG: hypothetical protein JZU47_03340 [Prolixibacteraceae bacterium]|nr:hypothetical protein [Prolixibacteraceae bacterium]
MEFKLFLFPHRTRFYGLILILVSLACAWLYFWGGKPDIFNIRIFAIVSAYIETRYFVWAQTNILDELAAVFLIAGITIISFSKEKNESDLLDLFRVKALYNSLFITLALWILCILLIYGLAIFIVSSGVLILYLINYNILFRYYMYNKSHSSN